jgi:glycine hydroxymethyltransferase
MVPFDDKSPFVTSGIRVGTAAITSRHLREENMGTIVTLIDKVLMNADNDTILAEVRKDVNGLMAGFPLYK